ncbi:terminase [Hyalangium versicolor]|uniref:terminase n=1 Tax=Hyalangium versicolor TaxID=2861190 RepID=UPI001CC9364D|nr:terminase [Hyalangium versicolor]
MNAKTMDDRSEGLLTWQWNLYTDNHSQRSNLIMHAVTVPLFQLGTLLLFTSPLTSIWLALPGLVGMVGAMAVQGRGHRLETTPPVPFRGPLDVVARIFVEQWITFPRFVLSGGFARAWRAQKGT